MSPFDTIEKREIAGRARTLHERVEGRSNVNVGDAPFDVDEVLDGWQARYSDDRTFEKRLEMDGLSPELLRDQVTATHWPADESLPDWVDELTSVVEYVQASDRPNDQQRVASSKTTAFEQLLVRFAEHAHERLDDVPANALSPLVEWLVEELEDLWERVLYVEFKSFLKRRDTDRLNAEPEDFDDLPTEYYDQFVEELFDERLPRICLEYPVLARQLVILLRQWTDAVTTLCRRVDEDRSALEREFGVSGAVTELRPLADDKHAEGQVPVHVTFESGDVIYKPRSVSGGKAFHETLRRLDERLSTPAFDTPKYLPCGEYGWMETVTYDEPADRTAVERYYERAGVVLCLAYALNFSDCQLENVIVDGETPVLVDGETIFHHPIPATKPLRSESTVVVNRTVLMTALLPFSVGDPREATGSSVTESLVGFGERSEAATPKGVSRPVIKAKNTDVMWVTGERKAFDRSTNTPTIDGVDQPPSEYVDSILEGFDETYEIIRDLRADGEFFSEIVDTDSLGDVVTRVLYRGTQRYRSVLDATTGWDSLRDGVLLTVEMDKLAAPFFADSVPTERYWGIYEAERRALRRRDIPRFTSEPDSTAVFHDGVEIDASVHGESGFDYVRERIDGFGDEDRRRQKWFVRRSYKVADDSAEIPPATTATDEQFRKTSEDLFQVTMDAAFEVGDRDVWVSTTPRKFGLSLIPAEESLYYGRSGIALTAAGLYRVTGEERYRERVEDVLAPVVDRVESERQFELGGTVGVGSVVYAFSVIAALLNQQRYEALAETAAHTVTTELIDADDAFGVTAGTAGTLLGLLAHYERFGGEEIRDRAVACGERLLDARVPGGHGNHSVWRGSQDRLYTGFAHGIAGIAYALARLSTVTDDLRYARAAREALDFQSTAYDEERVNWASTVESEKYRDRWCHGRSGIVLGRIATAERLGDVSLTDGTERVLSAIASADPATKDHLCCGNLGRVETLLEGARHGLTDRTDAVRLAARCRRRWERGGNLSLQGHSDVFANPTWFNGTSGAAYSFLRVNNADVLPNVLLFE